MMIMTIKLQDNRNHIRYAITYCCWLSALSGLRQR